MQQTKNENTCKNTPIREVVKFLHLIAASPFFQKMLSVLFCSSRLFLMQQCTNKYLDSVNCIQIKTQTTLSPALNRTRSN